MRMTKLEIAEDSQGNVVQSYMIQHVSLQNIFKGKKIKASTYEYLLQHEIITSRAGYICKKCVENVEANLMKNKKNIRHVRI